MMDMLLHTLVWTGVLIAAVLVLRRPVARAFGPEAAYALWALPLLRLVLPPITLPAWMAPSASAPAPALVPDGKAEAVVWPAAAQAAPINASPLAETAPAGFDFFALVAALPWAEALVLIWLGGAGVFLWRRFAAYFALRADLLAEGREVGRARGWLGAVRLIETPATLAPLAMGVIDRVIALPPGFMALHDRQARDLALAHELAHHRGGDLLVNVLVQPLFALHWWNPLGRYGWLALRRDQETACDARVMARCDAQERAAYAALIARFAGAAPTTSPIALTAPMACPVLGEKSIIHRLRSLSMTHLSPRRRMAGRALLGAGLLALPLTASISYAASEAARGTPAPPAPPLAPAAPQAPTAPSAPDAPAAPEAPEAPEAPRTIMVVDSKGRVVTSENAFVTERTTTGENGEEKTVRVVVRGGAPDVTWLERQRADEGAAAARSEAIEIALREGLAEAERVRKDMPRIIEEAMAAAEQARGAVPRVIVRQACKPGSNEITETITGKDGTQVVTICQSRVTASARAGLEEARAEIARDKDIPDATRKRVLEQLDRQIARWREQEG